MVSNSTHCISCPPSCELDAFGINLSQSQFSDYSVDSVMGNSSAIRDRFFDALEIRNRVNDSVMSMIVGLLEDLFLNHYRLRSTLNLNIVNRETSKVVRLYDSMNAFVGAMQGDVNKFWSFVDQLQSQYSSDAGIYIDDFVEKLRSFATDMTYIRRMGVDSRGESTTNAHGLIVQLSAYHDLFQAGVNPPEQGVRTQTFLQSTTTPYWVRLSHAVTSVTSFSGSITVALSMTMTFLLYLAQYNNNNGIVGYSVEVFSSGHLPYRRWTARGRR